MKGRGSAHQRTVLESPFPPFGNLGLLEERGHFAGVHEADLGSFGLTALDDENRRRAFRAERGGSGGV